MKGGELKKPALILLLSLSLYWCFRVVPIPASDYKANLDNKAVLLCGVSYEIGEQVAYELAKQGARLVIITRIDKRALTLQRLKETFDVEDAAIKQVEQLMLARTDSKLIKIRENALKLGSPQVDIYSYDFSNVQEAHTIVDKAVELLGGLDYVILNHAQIPRGDFLKFEHLQTPEFIKNAFSVNVFSFIEILQQAMPHLQQSHGHLFVTSSTLGEVPKAGMAVFSATKHAINGFFFSLQEELTAKKSSVTLTIGSLGVIRTQELLGLFKLPNFLIGELKDCAVGIMDSLITRPTTFTYPVVHPIFARLMWFFSFDF